MPQAGRPLAPHAPAAPTAPAAPSRTDQSTGGNHITAYSIMKGPENIHNVLPTPAEMLKLNQADMFVHSGLDTEPWRDNLLKGAAARQWMETEQHRVNEFLQQQPAPGGPLAADGGLFAPNLSRYLDSDQMRALFHTFFSPYATRAPQERVTP